jgi:diadenylate cyclase
LDTSIGYAQTDIIPGIQSFLERIADRPWVALIELALIGIVVYTILHFFQGTRGARLVRAVVTILAVSFAIVWLIAERVDSARIKVLYPYFILGVFLVSLVSFQVELRRMLLRVGEGRWLQRFVKTTNQSIDPIVTAVERLSKKKIGALISVQRRFEVGHIADSGVPLDAVVTSELLETIFWPGSVLHDLGVIIASGRVVAAGCQFPLAESGDVDRSLGSRHRAALGMSQEAVGVVIVVSEETGTVSTAIRGRLRRAVKRESLRETLVKELSSEPSPPKSPPAKPAVPAVERIAPDGTGQAA